jgi:Domain of unknown function (DUF4351)
VGVEGCGGGVASGGGGVVAGGEWVREDDFVEYFDGEFGARSGFDLAKPTLRDRIKALSVEQVEALGEALLNFYGVDDLVTWLGNG